MLKNVEICTINLGGTLESEVIAVVELVFLPEPQKCNTAKLFNTYSEHPYSFKNER